MQKTAAFEAGVADTMEKIALGNTAAGQRLLGRVFARRISRSMPDAPKESAGLLSRIAQKVKRKAVLPEPDREAVTRARNIGRDRSVPESRFPNMVGWGRSRAISSKMERYINRPGALKGPKAEEAFAGGMAQQARREGISLPTAPGSRYTWQKDKYSLVGRTGGGHLPANPGLRLLG